MPYRIWSPFTHRRIGRRGACLLSLGVIQIVTGWTMIDSPPLAFHALTLFRLVPPLTLGLLWLIPGAISLAYAFVRRTDNDSWGFVAAYLMPFIWGMAYVLSWFPLHDLPAGMGLRAAVIYWGYAALVQVISGWSEEPSMEGAPSDGSG